MRPVAAKLPAIQDDVKIVQLAREIAMDVVEIPAILKRYEVTNQEWERIQRHPRFDQILKAAIVEWQSAINTEQRIKVKAAVLLEEWLGEANSRLHDRTESLAAKTELAKFLGRLAGLGIAGASIEGHSERFSLTINLGADASLKFEKALPTKVIDAVPTRSD